MFTSLDCLLHYQLDSPHLSQLPLWVILLHYVAKSKHMHSRKTIFPFSHNSTRTFVSLPNSWGITVHFSTRVPGNCLLLPCQVFSCLLDAIMEYTIIERMEELVAFCLSIAYLGRNIFASELLCRIWQYPYRQTSRLGSFMHIRY